MKSLSRLTIAFGVALASCQTVPAATASPILSSTLEAVQYEMESAEADSTGSPSLSAGITPDPEQEALTFLALQDLSLRLRIPIDQITIVSIKPAVWLDTSMGCPNLGRVAAPGKVTGFRILLEAGGLEYIYHTDRTSQIILCPPEKPDEPGLR